MNDDKHHKSMKAAVAVSADSRFALNLATFIGVGAGLGLVLGSLLGDLVSGMMYSVGAGVVVGSALEMYRRRTGGHRCEPGDSHVAFPGPQAERFPCVMTAIQTVLTWARPLPENHIVRAGDGTGGGSLESACWISKDWSLPGKEKLMKKATMLGTALSTARRECRDGALFAESRNGSLAVPFPLLAPLGLSKDKRGCT